ncbi:hypothetical protein KBY23_16425 [Ruegeria pomeroyi]|nr:hypothetical protein [Ruegeria pomeroyi]
MNKIEWDTEDGNLPEDDLWKLFSDSPDTAAETILFYSQIKPLLRKMRLTDETRYYHVYHHPGGFPQPPVGARVRVTVTQCNLRRVASAIAGRGNSDAAIQYVGRKPLQA